MMYKSRTYTEGEYFLDYEGKPMEAITPDEALCQDLNDHQSWRVVQITESIVKSNTSPQKDLHRFTLFFNV